ncbi:MAG: hypothetical protein IKU63_04505 [Bacteroidaceae bacterium]|nr:hypothetical protein [Bacteroidaceae bacterium]MBR5530747.1 hypothetical protein [Bacteroidaceae bacterium]
MKKTYIIPCLEVVEFSVENIVAVSVGTGDGSEDAGGALSKKRGINASSESDIWSNMQK